MKIFLLFLSCLRTISNINFLKISDLQVCMKIGGTQFNENLGWPTDAKIYNLLLSRFKSNTALNILSSPLGIAKITVDNKPCVNV